MSDNNEMTRLAFQDASAQFKQSLKQATMLKAYSGEPKRKSNGAADETPGTTKA